MSTNQQRREAAKRKLEHQMEARAARVKRNRMIAAGVTFGVVLLVAGLVVFFVNRANDQAEAAAQLKAQQAQEAKEAEKKQAEEQKKQLEEVRKAAAKQAREVKIPSKRMEPVQRKKPLPDPSSCKYTPSQEPPAKDGIKPPKETKVPATGTVGVTIRTSAGEIGLTLDRALAPCTVNSMVSLIQQGYYDGSPCHRLGIDGMQFLQCGDPTGQGTGGPGYTVPDEFYKQLKYGRGILAMANTGAPNSGGGQFFMVFGKMELPPNYTVFGTVSDAGLKTLDKIARKGIDAEALMTSQDGTGKPATEVKFTKVTTNGD